MNVFLNVFNELFHLFVIICYAVCKLLNGFAGYFLSLGVCAWPGWIPAEVCLVLIFVDWGMCLAGMDPGRGLLGIDVCRLRSVPGRDGSRPRSAWY